MNAQYNISSYGLLFSMISVTWAVIAGALLVWLG